MPSLLNLFVPSPRRATILACAVAAGALCLYLFCLAPSVATGGDSGELISASFRLGIAHPSGYALYCLLGKGFATVFPFGEIAWRYNVFSALCGALTAGLVAFLVERFLATRSSTGHSSPLPAIGAGLLLAGFIFFGAQSLIAEVYAPAGLANAALILCAAYWHDTRRQKWLLWLALGLGLSLSLHLSTVFLWPGLLVLGMWNLRRAHVNRQGAPAWRRAARPCAMAGAAFAVGLSAMLYLPWRASTFPEPPRETIAGQEYSWWQPLDWGHPADFKRWKDHVTVQQYKSLLWQQQAMQLAGHKFQFRTFAQPPAAALQQLKELCQLITLQWLWLTPLIPIGAWASWRDDKRRPLAALLTITFALNVFIAIHYHVDNVFDIANFLFPSYIVMAIWLGLGIAAMLEWAAKQNAWSWRLSMLAKLALLSAIATQWGLFVNTASWRDNTRARDAARQRVAAIEKLQKATGQEPVLLSFTDDTLFPFWYMQHVQGRAPGAKTPFGPAMHATRAAHRLPQYAARLLKSGPVAITQWQEDVDARFPYAPLTANGNLWELTTQALPPAAQPVEVPQREPLHARFLCSKIRRAEVIGFQADFVFKPWPPGRHAIFDRIRGTRQNGWLEVLVASRAMNLRPSPDQGNVRPDSPHASLLVFKQTRRLIVSQTAGARQTLRTMVPLQMPLEMPPGHYNVWARTVATRGDTNTPWTAAGLIELIIR